jgi:hypothetical protein
MKILILAANPSNTHRLRLDREVRDIEEGLIRAQQRDCFEVIQRWAVSFHSHRRRAYGEYPSFALSINTQHRRAIQIGCT